VVNVWPEIKLRKISCHAAIFHSPHDGFEMAKTQENQQDFFEVRGGALVSSWGTLG
jgi:hypothetical protein